MRHRSTQVAQHLLAIVQEYIASFGLATRPGAAGAVRLRELGAPDAICERFESAHPADRASGMRLAILLRRAGATPHEEYAALLHDLPKAGVGLLPRILHVLAGSPRLHLPLRVDASATLRLRTHAAESPRLAARCGAPTEVVELLEALALEEDGRASHDVRAQRLYALDSAEASQ